jgi:hypothetical protein
MIRQQPFQAFYISGVGEVRQALLALALPGLAGQDMAVAGLLTLQSATGGAPEALGRTPVRFQFGHGRSSFPVLRFGGFAILTKILLMITIY